MSTRGTDPWVFPAYTCDRCGAGLAFHGVRTETCPYCACSNFLPRAPSRDQPEPRFVLPFLGDDAWAHRQLKRWLGSRWFADSALASARVEDIRGVYLPAYVYSAVARTEFTAQIGEHYTETEEREIVDENGERKREQRTVIRTEYRPLAGQHVGYVTDVLVSASAALPQRELSRVEPFDLRQLRRFSPAFVTGFVHEEYSCDPEECRRTSHRQATDQVGAKLRQFMPGDGHSDLDWTTTVDWESLDPILVPVWIFVVRYREHRPPLRVVINGQSGRVGGDVPRSWWKIALAVLGVLGVAAAIAWWFLTRPAPEPPPPPPPPSTLVAEATPLPTTLDADEPRRLAADEPRRLAADEPRRLAADGPRRLAADEPRRLAADEPRRLAADEPRRLAADEPRRLAADGPRRLAADEPRRLAADGPRRLGADGTRRLAADEPRRLTTDEPRRLVATMPCVAGALAEPRR